MLGVGPLVPELPEVEACCRLFRRELGGKTIVSVEAPPDGIVMGTTPPEAFREAIAGRALTSVGRRGKYWWLDFGEPPVVFGHLGMSGWVRVVDPGDDGVRLHSHGKARIYDETGRPRFLKLMLTAEDGTRVAMTDGRRLARLWLGASPELDPRVSALGRDAYDDLPSQQELKALWGRSAAPIKALLLDQRRVTGIGNWIADEVLYRARIAPMRRAKTLTLEEWTALRGAIEGVLEFAVDVEADYERFPQSWLFHHRWGGAKGAESIEGREIVRETVGGRTTAWVPELQA